MIEPQAHTPASRDVNGYQSQWPLRAAGPPPLKHPRLGFFRELPALIIVAFTLAVLMKTFLIQAFYIPSESMVPTLLIGDRVLVNKLAYHFRDPRRGEVIVFIAKHGEKKSFWGHVRSVLFEGLGVTRPPDVDFIKRIIGLPGDTIKVDETGVTITPSRGKSIHLTEPYISSKDEQGPSQAPFKVPAGQYFVMGDNRANSADSRSNLGPIKRTDIIGKAFIKIWPIRRAGILHVPSYAPPAAKGRALPFVPVSLPIPALALVAVARRRE